MKLISWNVNGLRACMQKGFTDFVEKEDPDILALQETKMQPGQAAVPLTGYHVYWNSAEKKGYSGTAVFTKEAPVSVRYGIGIPVHDMEGRVITCEYPDFLFCDLLYPQFAGRIEAPCLPNDLGRRFPDLFENAGCAKTGDPVWRSECSTQRN